MSDKVKEVIASTIAGGAGGVVGTASSLATVSAAGSVSGLSTAGITSGLATLGNVVGGGMAAGIGMAAVPILVLGATGAILASDEIDTGKKVIAGVGASTGVIGSVATVSAVGTVGGLSAAGITSGLAVVGGVVGGGIASGIAITCAAPLAVGGTVYGLYTWLKN
jgi:hypothetical protein